ncbi:6-pyruvoyltetrahydropterin/6-carboxytetrahydropterin synthase [Solimonas aquatica]|uniref:6-carboxy-5,6,7,8-tetrahydropterin synthase n=1 Tax=Solimonas aquatica TaxID=489703 RepID=A0A1H9J845_9GAMM|nr:6-carboxytetrahydropterin synthase [Solimonas aquatica]SEQ83040.1 6-pyruvoyltetrahydropterin/6-carboxytetrahydropterin synthase [Solimonas aquatica]
MSEPVVYLTRRETFAAAHRLWSAELSEAENRELFGPCARDYGHGHNYVLEVTLRGGIDAKTGVVVNITELRDVIRERILADVDHRHLNHDSQLMHGINPTVENIAVVFWRVLHERFGALLYEVCLHETEKNWVRYRGE